MVLILPKQQLQSAPSCSLDMDYGGSLNDPKSAIFYLSQKLFNYTMQYIQILSLLSCEADKRRSGHADIFQMIIFNNNKGLISMKNLYKSNATIDTYQVSQSSAHNCPSCRCKSIDQSKLNQSISQPYLKQNQANEQNLYLSKQLSEAASTDRITLKPYRSTIFHSPSNKIIFKYSTGVSSKQANISFSYTSPPKNKKHHSSEARFNTRRFKETHFPQISQEEIDNIPVKNVAKNSQVTSPYYEVYTKQKTPEKHRVLKMKKEKSKQKLQVTISKSSSRKSISQQSQTPFQNPLIINDYQIDGPMNTPINALWVNGSSKTQKALNNEQIYRYLNKDSIPASIEYIKDQHISSKSIKMVQNSQHPLQEFTNQPLKERQIKKYPTIESIDVYEAQRYNYNVSERVKTNLSREEQTSLRYIKQPIRKSYSSQIQYDSEEIQLARSISQQLELNYDYYYPQSESDKSLSIHVNF